MPRRKTHTEDDVSSPSFEDALAALESIVESMEHEPLPLEELVTCYEKGSALLDRCDSILQSARNRIELITLRNKNHPDTETRIGEIPDPALPSGPPDDSDADNDDIRLF